VEKKKNKIGKKILGVWARLFFLKKKKKKKSIDSLAVRQVTKLGFRIYITCQSEFVYL